MGWSATDIPDLSDKVAVVTGSTDGLGREVARQLAARGASVIVSGRNAERGAAAARETGAVFERLDLGDLAAVRGFAGAVAARFPRIDLLVNNAGVAMIPALTRTADGFEMQVGTNFLGHYALTAALLPALAASGGARVVSVSSLAAAHVKMDFEHWLSRHRYRFGKSYGWSKLAMLLFALELDRRAKANGWPLASFGAHPGVAASNLQNAGPSLGRKRRGLVSVIGNLVTDRIGHSTAAGALPLLRAATDPDATGGSYFGPDGWGGIKGAPVAVAVPAEARSIENAARLWDEAEQLTGARWIASA